MDGNVWIEYVVLMLLVVGSFMIITYSAVQYI